MKPNPIKYFVVHAWFFCKAIVQACFQIPLMLLSTKRKWGLHDKNTFVDYAKILANETCKTFALEKSVVKSSMLKKLDDASRFLMECELPNYGRLTVSSEFNKELKVLGCTKDLINEIRKHSENALAPQVDIKATYKYAEEKSEDVLNRLEGIIDDKEAAYDLLNNSALKVLSELNEMRIPFYHRVELERIFRETLAPENNKTAIGEAILFMFSKHILSKKYDFTIKDAPNA